MTSLARPEQPARFFCRSYMAVVLVPEPPILEWVMGIEQRLKGGSRFLVGAPVVLDLTNVKLSPNAITHLVGELDRRGVRVMGLENTDPAAISAGMPPLVRSSKGVSVDLTEPKAPAPTPAPELSRKQPA